MDEAEVVRTHVRDMEIIKHAIDHVLQNVTPDNEAAPLLWHNSAWDMVGEMLVGNPQDIALAILSGGHPVEHFMRLAFAVGVEVGEREVKITKCRCDQE